MSSDDDLNPWSKPKTPKKKEKEPSSTKEDVINDFVTKIKEKVSAQTGGGGNGGGNMQMPKIPQFSFLYLALAGLGIWFLSGFYIVDEGARSVVLRFGSPVRTAMPGPNYRLPWPLEENFIIKITNENKIESLGRSGKNNEDESFTLTGDQNMIKANYVVSWKVSDISDFLFTNKDPEITIRAAAESAMREVIGQQEFLSVITGERKKIADDIGKVLQNILNQYKIGVEVVSFQLQSLDPPTPVSDAFQDMQTSTIDAKKMKLEAQAYDNDIIPRARGEAVKRIEGAKAYAQDVMGKAKGEIAEFEAKYNASRQNRSMTFKRLYLEGMQNTLAKVPNKTIVDGNVTNNLLPHLSLNKKNKE